LSKVLIFGNSGSGKSYLARKLCAGEGLQHLDLDTLAWKPGDPPQREALAVSATRIENFTARHGGWAIEGCYTDLLELAAPRSTEIIYLNLPVSACIANARSRPWEPHKYPSKAAQDKNLGMLLDWIAAYEERSDLFSKSAHLRFYAQYPGPKVMRTANT
jgi:adenylate kinase family enzyme